jgi:hypothetical protein
MAPKTTDGRPPLAITDGGASVSAPGTRASLHNDVAKRKPGTSRTGDSSYKAEDVAESLRRMWEDWEDLDRDKAREQSNELWRYDLLWACEEVAYARRRLSNPRVTSARTRARLEHEFDVALQHYLDTEARGPHPYARSKHLGGIRPADDVIGPAATQASSAHYDEATGTIVRNVVWEIFNRENERVATIKVAGAADDVQAELLVAVWRIVERLKAAGDGAQRHLTLD